MKKRLALRKWLIHSLIMFFCLYVTFDSFAYQGDTQEQTFDRLMDEAVSLYQTGEYEGAIEACLKALSLARTSNQYSDSYFYLSLVYFSISDFEKSEYYIQMMFQIEPENKIIDESQYPMGYLNLFNGVKQKNTDRLLQETKKWKTEETEKDVKTSNVKTAPQQMQRPRRKKNTILVISGFAAGGVAALLLLLNKRNGEGPSAPTIGSIQVDSTPTGAKIYLDGTDTGKTTNATLTNVPPGVHIVKLVKEGYKIKEQSISVTGGQTVNLNVSLSKHTISVASPMGSTTWRMGSEVEITWTYDEVIKSFGNIDMNVWMNFGSFQKNPMFIEIKEGTVSGNRSSKGKYNLGFGDGTLSRESGEFSKGSIQDNEFFQQKSLLKDKENEHVNLNRIKSIKSPGPLYFPELQKNPINFSHPEIQRFRANDNDNIRLLILTNIKIELYRGNALVEIIASSTENDGAHKWTASSSLAEAENYKIRISCSSDSGVYGESDEFKIKRFPDMEWIPISAGQFYMGDNFYEGDADELPVHLVYLDSYYISKYEVTFEQYDTFCDETGRSKPSDNGWGRGNRPVINVSQDDAIAFCDWISVKSGQTVRLPTEAQWEKAARGTDQRRFPWGNSEPTSSLANYNRNKGMTQPVGSYPLGASPYGVHDMAGNVREWCLDWYGYYSDGYTENPQGPSSGSSVVLRNGDWESERYYIRCMNRYAADPELKEIYSGFRCVRIGN